MGKQKAKIEAEKGITQSSFRNCVSSIVHFLDRHAVLNGGRFWRRSGVGVWLGGVDIGRGTAVDIPARKSRYRYNRNTSWIITD